MITEISLQNTVALFHVNINLRYGICGLLDVTKDLYFIPLFGRFPDRCAPRDLRRGFAVYRLLELWVRIPPGAWMAVSCECCVSSGIGHCFGSITRPEEFYRLWCV